MNRRRFFSNLIGAAAEFAILPSAVTYSRKWIKPKQSPVFIPNPEWVNAPYEIYFWGLDLRGGFGNAPRFELLDSGIFQRVEPFKQIQVPA